MAVAAGCGRFGWSRRRFGRRRCGRWRRGLGRGRCGSRRIRRRGSRGGAGRIGRSLSRRRRGLGRNGRRGGGGGRVSRLGLRGLLDLGRAALVATCRQPYRKSGSDCQTEKRTPRHRPAPVSAGPSGFVQYKLRVHRLLIRKQAAKGFPVDCQVQPAPEELYTVARNLWERRRSRPEQPLRSGWDGGGRDYNRSGASLDLGADHPWAN